MINPITFQNIDLSSTFVGGTSTAKNFIITLLIIAILWVIYLILRFTINRRFKNIKHRYTWRTRAFYTILVLSIYFIGRVWLDSLSDVFTFLSIIAAALTITQKESLMNLIGCALIYWRELFHTGDRIQVGNYYGEVTSIRTFYFHMLECDPKKSGDQTTGKIIKVPNGLVITAPIVNLSELFPFNWQEFNIILTPDSDIQTAKTVLAELIDKEVKHYYLESKHYLKKFVRDNFISEQQLKTQSFIKLHQEEPGGFLITIRYLSLPTQTDELHSHVIEKFMDYIKVAKVAKIAFS